MFILISHFYSMSTKKLQKHRDVQLANNANSAVKRCIYSDINKNCIDTLLKNTTDTDNTSKLSNGEIVELLIIAKESNSKSKDLLVSNQNSIPRCVYKIYAKSQVNQLQLMHKNSKKVNDVQSVSKFILVDKMIEMSNKVHAISDRSGM